MRYSWVSRPGGGCALPLIAPPVAQPVAGASAAGRAATGAACGAAGGAGGGAAGRAGGGVVVWLWWWFVVWGCWNGEGRHAVWRCRPSGFVVLWRCPTLPRPIGCSTIGAAGLSFQVRNGAGRFPGAVTTTRFSVQHAPRQVIGGVWVDRGVHSGCGVCCLYCFTQRVVGCLFSVGPLVPVGSRAPRGASTSGLSTR